MKQSMSTQKSRLPWEIVWALSVTQIVAWGSIYYAISVLLPSIETELGWSRDAIIGAFSLSLLFAGLGAFPVGLSVDRYGGRIVMTVGSIAGGVLLMLLSQTHSLIAFYVLWAGLGLSMAMVLYEPAFAVITQSFGDNARKGITALTLAGGFASTVFWPLTQYLVAATGWRNAVVILALCNLLLCAPLHAVFLPGSAKPEDRLHAAHRSAAAWPAGPQMRQVIATRSFWMLAFAFTANMLAFSALSVHLIPLLHEKGYGMDEAVWIAALVGPMQVAGRIGEYTIGSRFRATQVAIFALALLPVALVSLGHVDSAWLVMLLFVIPYGASNGIMTIARGVIPIEIFGRERYGAVNGALSSPVIASRALGPFAAALIWSASGGYAAVLWTLAGIGLLSLAAFTAAAVDRRTGK
jgi:MFS family permease